MASDRMRSSGDRASAEVEMQAWIMGIRPQIEGRVELLFEQASSLEKRYLEALEAGEDSGTEGSGKPVLGLRVRRCGDAIVRHWYGIDGQGANGDEQPSEQGSSGGADANESEMSCPVENLLQRMPVWDDALGSEIEDQVIQYRHWAQCVGEMLVKRVLSAELQTPVRRLSPAAHRASETLLGDSRPTKAIGQSRLPGADVLSERQRA